MAATAAHLEKLVTGKLSSVNPSTLPDQPGTATLIKYTPGQQGAQASDAALDDACMAAWLVPAVVTF